LAVVKLDTVQIPCASGDVPICPRPTSPVDAGKSTLPSAVSGSIDCARNTTSVYARAA
jgi:hypothetical protein